jgi:hypothetical protein
VTYQPPGHVPGFHLPGTLVPIGAAIAAIEESSRTRATAVQALAIELQRKSRSDHLLLLRH